MLEEEVYHAYEAVKPDSDARDRMLQNIYSHALHRNSAGMGKNRIKYHTRFAARFAAALAAALIVPAVAYAGNFFGLRDLGLGREKIEDYSGQEAEIGTIENTSQQQKEVDIISLGGIADGPEYKACAEWRDFLDGYDTDKAILSAVGNNATGLSQDYEIAYGCYSREMADKVDEICGKYQLSKLSSFQFAEDYNDLCRKAGVGDFCQGVSENGKQFYGGYLYSDGTFHMEGNVILASPSLGLTDYQLMRSMKGSFNAVVLNVGRIEEYSQWNYTTKNGVSVLLANSSEKALIIVEREKSFIVVNILGDIMSGTFQVSNEMLEELADAFDFSAIY